MASEQDVMNAFDDLTAELLEKVYFGALYNIAFRRKRSWFVNRIERRSDEVQGLEVNLTFLKTYGWSWRPMTEFGFTSTGDKLEGAEMTARLGCHTASAQVTKTAIEGTDGDFSRIGSIVDRSMRGLLETFPYYIRALLWTPESGILGRADGAAVANVVTLDNTGLPHSNQRDAARYFEPGMVVQVYDLAQAKRGTPVHIISVDKELGTITLESDPGIALGDLFTLSDIAGQDETINQSSPGVLDAIDDDNTFQAVDRSLATNEALRSVVNDNGGVPRLLDRTLLTNFLHDVYDPDHAFSEWRVVRGYWSDNFRGDIRYQQAMDFIDGYQGVQVGRTALVEDDDGHFDKIVVPNFPHMFIADKGNVESLFDMGWRQIPGRPFIEYPVVYWARLMADDTRHMGVLSDLNTTA
jgi:hypothetical protein